MIWSEEKIATTLARQIFQRKCLVVVPNCSWTGDECDLLAVTKDLRVIDVEVKISRSDYRADAKKDKWFEHWTGSWNTPMHQRVRTPRQWPRKAWKHYYAMPKAIWKPEMADQRPSENSGIILLNGSSDFPMGNLSRIQIKPAAVEIDGDLEVVTVPESTGTFLYSCNL